jgi:hypothetical protein
MGEREEGGRVEARRMDVEDDFGLMMFEMETNVTV